MEALSGGIELLASGWGCGTMADASPPWWPSWSLVLIWEQCVRLLQLCYVGSSGEDGEDVLLSLQGAG